MDVQQLRCFLAVAQEGHFGRAAARLHLTTSPVSRAVKDLERELGGELFVRRYHQVELTPAGRHLLGGAEQLVADLDLMVAEVRDLARVAARTFHIGGTHLAPSAVLDAVLAAAEKVDPLRPLDVSLAQSADLLLAAAAGDVDLAVVHLPIADSLLASLPLATYGMTAVLRSDDPMAGRAELQVADLAGHTFVTMADSVHPTVMERMRVELAARGLTKVETVPAADVLMIVAKTRRRGSVTFVPREGDLGRMFDEPRFTAIPVLDAPDIVVGVVWRKGTGDPMVRDVVSRLAPE